jgi:mutator protein MutT
MHDFISFLEHRLSKSLPGREAQIKMAPKPISGGEQREMKAPEHANQSSVLVLLFPNEENELELTLTLRTNDIDHGGQISFPGGRAEAGETVIETALREAHEEIGINPESVSIIGQLSDLYVSNSNNLVTPVVGFMSHQPKFTKNPKEVEEVFAVEIDSLLHKKNLTVEDWSLSKHTYRVPYWDIHQVPLWGATAMMLNELLELFREYQQDQ